ncbi:MAG: hypothetical protein ACRC50_03575 [Gaiella sp.]
MGMGPDSTPLPSLAELRAVARSLGVDPTDEDLERVLGFLGTVLPDLRAIEEATARSVPPAGMYLPDPESA